MLLFFLIPIFAKKKKTKKKANYTLVSKSKQRVDLICNFSGMFGSPLPPLSPRNPHTPASLHLTFPLVTRVHMRRPSDFRFTFANTVAVIHNIASCCFHFVLVQLLSGWFYIGHKTQSLRDVFRWHGSKIYEEAVIKIEENYSLKNVFKLTFPLFLVYTDWVCASGLRCYFTCNLLDFRFRPQEYG